MVDVDIRGFAGADSINAVGSFVSSTVNAGAGSDTMFINTSPLLPRHLPELLSTEAQVLT